MEKQTNSIVQHGEEELLAMYRERGVQSLPALKGEPIWPQAYFDRSEMKLRQEMRRSNFDWDRFWRNGGKL